MTDTSSPLVGFRISPRQERLWQLTRFGVHDNAIGLAVRIEGPLDVLRFRQAFEATVLAHEILRTKLHVVIGLEFPLQVVEPTRDIVLGVEPTGLADLVSGLHHTEGLRAALSRHAPDQHFFLLAISTLLCDDESLRILVHRIAAVYNGAALTSGLEFADVAEWQHEQLDLAPAGGTVWKETAAYGVLPPLVFEPSETNGPATVVPGSELAVSDHGPEAGAIDIAIAHESVQAVRATSARLGMSPRAVFLAVWARVLASLAGTERIVLGVRVDGRAQPELATVLGPLAHHVPVALDVVAPFEARIKAADRALAFTERPLPSEGTLAAPTPDFAFDADDWAPVEVGQICFGFESRCGGLERFALCLHVTTSPDRWTARVSFDRQRFAEVDVCRIARQWSARLAGDNDGLPEAELQELLRDFSGASEPETVSNGAATVLELFDEQVRRSPGQPAIVTSEYSITYGELARKSERLAARLREHGVGAEMIVAVHLSRSPELLASILAILRAGAAYLPLDPEYPAERNRRIVKIVQPSVVVATERDAANFVGVPLVSPDAVSVADRPLKPPLGSDLAYVICTSGSTASPRAVLVSHANLLASTRARLDQYPGEGAQFLLLSSAAFDSSVAGIFGTLAGGGTLVLPAWQEEKDPDRIALLIAERRVTRLLCLPSLYQRILEQARDAALRTLDTVIVAGEALLPNLVALHAKRAPAGATLFNEYGPTEGTVWSTVHVFDELRSGARVPVGRPIPGTRVYVLDSTGELCPVGVCGELWIGGEGVARGYHSEPAATADRFRPDPFALKSGERLYRTGDLACFDGRGRLHIYGRTDDQVKIRGVRVEPAEVASAIRAYPGVVDVAVIGDSAAGSLAAYLVVCEPIPHGMDLRQFLAARLPQAMIPSLFRLVPELPRLPNGKLDRATLLTSGGRSLSRGAGGAPPVTHMEKEVAGVWSEVLALEDVGIDDGFFDLGGHSFLLLQIHHRLQQLLFRTFPLLDLLECPTVRALSVRLEERTRDGMRLDDAKSDSDGARVRAEKRKATFRPRRG